MAKHSLGSKILCKNCLQQTDRYIVSCWPLKSCVHITRVGSEQLPAANEIAAKILCLPIYPDLTNNEQSKVIELINQYSLKFPSPNVSNIG
ncbi:DegT/DnrJ/EryC1/StrS family aminotransferase [Phytobacter sp. V91]|uniref:DegT/DnrJ/EryC1/StrS family aminotransferase n=1 Tax=Phytobacter sp. V91 TaxID=3369425 RepID=UPI003F62C829